MELDLRFLDKRFVHFIYMVPGKTLSCLWMCCCMSGKTEDEEFPMDMSSVSSNCISSSRDLTPMGCPASSANAKATSLRLRLPFPPANGELDLDPLADRRAEAAALLAARLAKGEAMDEEDEEPPSLGLAVPLAMATAAAMTESLTESLREEEEKEEEAECLIGDTLGPSPW